MTSVEAIRDKVAVEAVKKVAVIEHLSGQIAALLSDITGHKSRIQIDLEAGFVFVALKP